MRLMEFARVTALGAASLSALAQAPLQQPAAPASAAVSAPRAAVMGAPPGATPIMPTRPMNMNPPPTPLVRTPVPPAPPTPPISGLPSDAPKLVINGGIYSENRSVRAAIVNGNVVREGADLGSGVVLAEIRPSGVVLTFHGNRYNILY
jgi:general secretion pathway protein B